MPARELNTQALDTWARHLVANLMQSNAKSRPDGPWIRGPEYVWQDLYKMRYKDAHEYVVAKIRGLLGPEALKEFDEEAKKRLTPRSDEVFHALLAEWLAIDKDGNHIPGKIGRGEKGRRVVGVHRTRFGATKEATWPIYPGEDEERAAGAGPDVVDPLPPPGSVFFDNEHLRIPSTRKK